MFLVVLSYPVFSNQESCKQTVEFELGLQEAENQKFRLARAIGWGVLSYSVIAILGEAGFIVGWLRFPDPEAFWGMGINVLIGTLVGAGIGTAVSIAIPAMIVSRPKVIPDHISEEGVECYLDGYAAGTRRNRVRGAAIGCTVFWSFAILYVGTEMLLAS